METILKLSGRIPSKKNSRITTRSGRSFPSKKYKEWNEAALWELKAQKPPQGIDRAEIMIVFHMPDNRKADLTNKAESVMDTLVDAGILKDDCWQMMRPLTLNACIDREDPRAEVLITHIDDTEIA